MTTITDPVIGRWYKDIENDLSFKVVAIDEDNDDIEVQYLNGDITSFDKDSWYDASFDYIEALEDWSAPFDDLELDDLGYSDDDLHQPDQEDIDPSDWIDR